MSLPPDDNNDSDSIDDGITYYNLKDLVAEYDAQCQNDADTPNGESPDDYISYTPIGREPFFISHPLNQSNSLNNHEDAAPDTELFTPGTHLNDLVCNNYVQEQRRDTGYSLPNVVNQPTIPLQQLSIQSSDEALQMNSHYSANTQNYDSYNELFSDTAAYSLPNVANQPAAPLQQPNTESTDDVSQMNSHNSANTQNYDSYNELFSDTAAYSLPNVVNQPAAPLQQPNIQSTDDVSQMNSHNSAITQNYDSYNELFRDTAAYSLPNVVNQPAAPLQQPNIQSTDDASQMNSHYSANTQNYDSYNELFRDTAAYSLPNVVNQPAAPLQQPNIQSTDDVSQMNSDSSVNTQNYVQPNNQQPHLVAQSIPTVAPPSQISGPFFIELSEKSALKVCTTQEYEKETGRSLSMTPILPKTQNMNTCSWDPKPFRLDPETANAIQQCQTSNTVISGLPQNNIINIVNVKTVKSNPIRRNVKILPKPLQYTVVDDTKAKPDKRSSQPIASSGSKDSSLPTNSGMEVETDLEKKPCNCTKTQCLQLYCECFRRGKFCQNCKCIKCLNNIENEQLRSEAVQSCLLSKPESFLSKVGKEEALHKKGCSCKRSRCKKNYCECYRASIPCSSKCKCGGCLNHSTEENVSEEVPRVNIEDVPNLIVETTDSDSSERSGEDNGYAERRLVAELTNTENRDFMTECMLRAAAGESNERDQLSKVMEAFSKSFVEILEKIKTREKKCEGKKSTGTEEK